MTQRHGTLLRYDRASLRGDYIRAGVGAAFCAAGFVLSGPAGIVAYLFGAGGGLFAVFGGRTAIRHAQAFQLTEEEIRLVRTAPGLSTGGVRWDALTKLRLRFYSTKRDRREGWMQLTLKSPGRTISVDSTLEGFDTLARTAARAAGERGLTLDRSSASNLAALGIELPESPKNHG